MIAIQRLIPWFSRLVLLAVTVLFALIGGKFIADPVGAAAASDMSLDTRLAVTNMRASFGAFPLGVAVVSFACLISGRRHRTGLIIVGTIMGIVLAVRAYGALLDGTLGASARLLTVETVMLALSILAILGEASRRQTEAAGALGGPRRRDGQGLAR
jgi:hypothetical protein